jgi:rfaE bifunctional protein nucleotidyltransferase chain/domain
MYNKILNNRQLESIRKKKRLVLCHGVFDLFHYGHLKHFESAKSMGDILIVSLTADKYVNKGPNRPYNNIKKRLDVISSLEIVDYVTVSNSSSALDVLKNIKPDFYVKGPDYKDKKKDITKKIFEEEKIVKKYGGKIIFTNDETQSSTTLLNKYFINYENEQIEIIKKIKKKFNSLYIEKILDKFKNLDVLVLGEPIIDEYNFTKVLGLGSKSPIISVKFIKKKNYPGGSLAIANHLEALGCKTSIVLPFTNSSIVKNIYNKIHPRVKIKYYKLSNWKIPIKSRFLHNFRSQKVFEINYIKDLKWSKREILIFNNYLNKISFNKDLIFIADFGHGMFDKNIIKKIENINVFKALNVQTNSANFGFNFFSKYNSYNHLTLDERELRLALRDSDTPIKTLLKSSIEKKLIKTPFSLTLGEKGGIYVTKNFFFHSPVFFKDVIDTTGSGDAYFSISSLLAKVQCEEILIPFISNCYAGLKTRVLGNNPIITKADLIKTINGLLS